MKALAAFLELQAAAQQERIGDGGRDTCAALAVALDAALAELAVPLLGEPVAVVAVGGYGRGEQCIFSDIDVMLLHDGVDAAAATTTMLYPLWDAKLKVGHSVRTVKEAVSLAAESFETLTSLLTMRCIAGDADLVAELEAALSGILRGRPLAPRLAAAEWERRQLDPYPVLATDLKDGRGGLRTFQGFEWERRRAALLSISPGAMAPTPAEMLAQADLLAVRNALHAAAGRAGDRFVPDLRESAARWLDVDLMAAAEMVCRSTRIADRLAERRWPDLIAADGDRMVAFGRSVFGRITSRFRRRNEEEAGTNGSALTMAARAAGRSSGVWLDTIDSDRIRSSRIASWTQDDRDALLHLLAGGERGRVAWGLVEDLGWVEASLPEWSPVVALPQLAPFHEHPVDAHLWRTVDEIRRLENDDDPLVREVFEEVASTEELMLAAWLHDIGKGRGGDHAVVGASVARTMLDRMGFGPATKAVVSAAVRHHLLLAETATRRNLADPAVIGSIADAVGDLRTLQVLYLLAIADARATGASMWTAWKGALLRSVYVRTADMLGMPTHPAPSRIEEAVAAAAGRLPARVVEEHLASLPAEYVETVAPEDIVWHIAVLAEAEGPVTLDVRAGAEMDRVVVGGDDRSGFLGAVATAFAVHGVSVVSARLFTRSDGAALDLFDVIDDRSEGPVPPDRWDRVLSDITAALQGERTLDGDLARRMRAYRTRGVEREVSVRFPDDRGRHTLVEVRCGDRVGRLAQIVGALYLHDVDISVAKLDSRAGEVLDTFYVRRNGHPITEEADRAAIVASLTAALA